MPQTLFCLAALLVFAGYGLTRHRTAAADEAVTVVSELEAAALRVAQEASVQAKNVAFDEADIGRDALRLAGDTDGLTEPAQFGRGLPAEADERASGRLDDVDDFHMRVVRTRAEVAGADVAFDVAFFVRYLDPATLQPVGRPTTLKEVVTLVSEVAPDGARPPARVTLRTQVNSIKLALHN